jgi:hypothetical protein
MIRKAELRQKVRENKIQKKKNQKRRGNTNHNNLFMIQDENEDSWTQGSESPNRLGHVIENNIRQLKNTQSANQTTNLATKAKKFGFHKSNKVKSTNHEFLMTSFMSIGVNASKGMQKEMKNKKKSVKSSKRSIFKRSNK